MFIIFFNDFSKTQWWNLKKMAQLFHFHLGHPQLKTLINSCNALVNTPYSMVLQIICADILQVVSYFSLPRRSEEKCEQWVKCPRVLSVKPSNKRFIIPLHSFPAIFYYFIQWVTLNQDATVQYAYYSVIRSHILRVLLSLYGKMT